MRNAGRTRVKAVIRTLLATVLSLAMVSALTACKPTDLFTEIVITPFSDVIDYNNPTKTIVNSPDAVEESALLTALDWTDESPRSLNEENLVTYSDAPTSTLTAHHSVFDLSPRFNGIMASDPVRFTFSSDSSLDHESEASEQDASALQAAATSIGGTESQDDSEAAPSNEAADGDSTGGDEAGDESGGSDETGDNPDGTASNPDVSGEGDGEGDNPGGKDEDPYGGYNGDVSVYNPGDGFARVNRVEHLAVLGTDVAVMAQSLGGAYAICAMNEYAYYGLDSAGVRTTTYASFIDVFSGEIPVGFEQSGLLWSADGSKPANVKDIDALVAACGQRGLIVYDQRMGNANDLFNLDQRRRLQAAEIQLAPVDMSTVQGMLDAAQVIGEALSESSECEQDALAMSRDYIKAVNDIVRSVADTNGGYLAVPHAVHTGRLLTSYNSPPVSSYHYTHTFGFIATESESGLSSGYSGVDASRIVLFGNNSGRNTPLSFWMQTTGVWDNTESALLMPLRINDGLLDGGRSGGALSRWLGSRRPHTNWMASEQNESGLNNLSGLGLGSYQIPYLIVCAFDGSSAGQVKSAVVESMLHSPSNGYKDFTPYSVLRYNDKRVPVGNTGTESYSSTIGASQVMLFESPFFGSPQLAVSDVVRENPVGLLGSWTEGNMESVLEAVWLADIYSRSPVGCGYDPVTDMSKFQVSIGGTTCTTTRETVRQFYWTFYRCDVDAPGQSVYNDIVTDEGF